MKKIIAFLLTLAMLLSLAACGGKDPNAGTYNAVSCKALGISLDCEGDWLELKGNGKGKVCLMGEEYNCSWTLEGENFTLKNHGDEFSGTLHNGIITLDYGDMIYVYMMDGVVTEAGETLGHVHQWKEADCENSKCCAECGSVEGEPLGHDATEANYQQPSVCKRCGVTLAEKLQADMEKYGFTEFLEVGVLYPFEFVCIEDNTKTSVGEVIVTDYQIFESAEGYPAKEGYEWRVATMKVRVFDNNAYKYNVSISFRFEDYYNITFHDDTSSEWVQLGDRSSEATYKLIYNGQEMEGYHRYIGSGWSKWNWTKGENHGNTYVETIECQVPVGYDGTVFGIYDYIGAGDSEKGYITDIDPSVCKLFRLVNKEPADAAVADDGIAGDYSLYALEDSGEYIDNATLVSLEMDGLVVITFHDDGTGVMTTEGEAVTFTYDDTTISDADGFTYKYVLEAGMLKVDVGNGQIFHCQKIIPEE